MSAFLPSLNLSLLRHKLLLEQCHFAFFGASVTQQGEGYVSLLQTLLAKSQLAAAYPVSQLGFGSLHLASAVLLLEETVLTLHRKQPIQVCVLEWFTSGPDIVPSHLDQLIVSLLKEGILPVLVLLYNDQERDKREKTKLLYYQAATRYTIPLLDLDTHVSNTGFFSARYFRDYTHLHTEGAAKIAHWLAEALFDVPIAGMLGSK